MNSARWYRLDVITAPDAADLVTQMLVMLGCQGSVIQTDPNGTVVTGYLPHDGRAGEWEAALRERIDTAITYGLMGKESRVCISETPDEDWAESWKLHFRPIDVGQRFRIVPPWIEASATDRIVIQIDPGMAFGTGQHATTVLCLELLEELLRPEDTVVDVGTGSGILAIAAARLGAKQVIAVDSDPVCPPAARKNCAANGVGERVTLILGDLLTCVKRPVDVIVANLTSYGTTHLAPHVPGMLRPGGCWISSGIPAEKTAEVQRALLEAGLAIEHLRERDGWVAIAARDAMSLSLECRPSLESLDGRDEPDAAGAV